MAHFMSQTAAYFSFLLLSKIHRGKISCVYEEDTVTVKTSKRGLKI